MEQNIHYDILGFFAEDIVAELYAKVQQDARLMVCDWRAYAILEAYKRYSVMMGISYVPDIEQCFSGEVTPTALKESAIWNSLGELHELHWGRYNEVGGSREYSRYLNITKLCLEHYILTI